ncbi:MAG: MFS transporter [Bacteroidaceae bacterium]|nr:MFS transporter [Bacteroidaceae bacterium]
MQVEKLWNSNYVKVWFANFMIFFSFMVVTPLLPLYLSEEFGADKHTIGVVLSGYTLTALLMRPFSGYLVDSFPRRVVLLTAYFLFFSLFAGYIVAGSLTLFAIVRTIHGGPMGAVTVANSTCAIDVLHPSRRAEGIGYYGLSNNLATSMAPTIGLLIYAVVEDYDAVFAVALAVSFIGLLLNWAVRFPDKEVVPNKAPISLDRFFLVKGSRLGVCMVCIAFSYGVISTYIAIYSKEELGMTTGSGLWFAVLCGGLMVSRLFGARSLREGRIVENASHGFIVSLFGYMLFAMVQNPIGYYGAALIIGLGNGHVWPAVQNMFVNLGTSRQRGTANSTILTSWDVGIGLGVILGGIIAEYISYTAAFMAGFLFNAVGVALYFLTARNHYLLNKH